MKDRALCYPIFTHLVKQHQFIIWGVPLPVVTMLSNLWQDKFVTARVVQVVWSSIGAVGAFSFTELMPFIALTLVV